MQETLYKKKLTPLQELELKRKILYKELLKELKRYDILRKQKIVSYNQLVKPIDEKIERLTKIKRARLGIKWNTP